MKGSMIAICRDLLEARGVDTSGMYPAQVVEEAMATGELAQALGTSLNKRLLKSYDYATGTWQGWVLEGDVNDFREVKGIRVSNFGILEKVRELGEYTETKLSEKSMTWYVEKYGKDFSISWEDLTNDDLRAIQRKIDGWGTAAAGAINAFAYSFLKDNPVTYDAKTLFHTDHANVLTDVLGQTGLGKAIQLMMEQDDEDDNPIVVVPKSLIVPPALAETGRQLLKGDVLVSVSGGTVQSFTTNTLKEYNLQLIVEPRLKDEPTRWFVAADPALCPSVEIDYLRGVGRQPQVLKAKGKFDGDVDALGERDEIRYRVRHVFGGAAFDYRGLVRSTGAGT